ncbi:hypothetical protein ABAC402_16000 [Asticcacaulis sp. AC402]|nr:hypothetical protein ABAC402_16000 [Asticcacaulis sp. AC402]
MAGAATTALFSAPALAQEAAGDEVVVIVTAQKRAQRLQDVPIAITSLSAKTLQEAGVRDIKDMQILTPGLTVTSTTNESSTTARIRGVGTVGDNPGLESSVGVVIDGIYRPRNGVGFEDLGEMERIEVLKGPQGTLFGKNTSAGVINVITKKPQFTFGADAEATVGNYGANGFSGSVTGPMTDEVAYRLYYANRKRDGYNNVNTGVGPRTLNNDGDQNFHTARGQLLFVPNDNIDIRVIGDYTHRDENCCVSVQIRTGPTGSILNALAGNNGVAAANNVNIEDRLAYANRGTRQVSRDGGVSVESNIKLPDFLDSTLTSVTGMRDWKSTNGQDIDYTGADILYRRDNGDFNARFKTFSQEVRLAGATESLNWLVGGFYVKEDLTRQDSYVYGSHYQTYLSLLLTNGTNPGRVGQLTSLNGNPANALGAYTPGDGAKDSYTQNVESWALFTNNSWKVSEQLEMTLGLRYTSETKKMTALYTNTAGNTACGAAQRAYGTTLAQMNTPGATVTNAQWQQIIGADTLAPVPAGTPTRVQTVLGNLCPFWANPAFSNRRVADENSDGDLSGTLKAAWRFNDDVMAYASFARGYKAGGYNLDRAQTGLTPDSELWFLPETVNSYELGIKTNLFDNNLTLNVTAFDQAYENFQLNTFLGTAFVVESIPQVNSKGFDADFSWRTPLTGLTIAGGLTYADTVYGDFTAADLINPTHFPGLSLLPGATVSFAPKWSGSTAISWGGNIGDLRAFANVTAKYSSEYNTGSDLIAFKEQEAYTLVNGRVGIGAQDRRWTLELWGQNLTDETYRQVVINGPLQGAGFQTTVQTAGSNPGTYYDVAKDTNTYDAFIGAPKTYGLTLRVRY